MKGGGGCLCTLGERHRYLSERGGGEGVCVSPGGMFKGDDVVHAWAYVCIYIY